MTEIHQIVPPLQYESEETGTLVAVTHGLSAFAVDVNALR